VRSARPFCSGEYGAVTSRVMPFSCRNCVNTPLVHSLASSEWRYATSVCANSGNCDFQVCISHCSFSTACDFRVMGNAHLYHVKLLMTTKIYLYNSLLKGKESLPPIMLKWRR
jgi:hypothetical protein